VKREDCRNLFLVPIADLKQAVFDVTCSGGPHE
jgi:hypothetical protein